MDRIILCAGRSSRFHYPIQCTSKCLVDVDGKSLLGGILEKSYTLPFDGFHYVMVQPGHREAFEEALRKEGMYRDDVRIVNDGIHEYITPTSTLTYFLERLGGQLSERVFISLGDIWFSDMRFHQAVSTDSYSNVVAVSPPNDSNVRSTAVAVIDGLLGETGGIFEDSQTAKWCGMAVVGRNLAHQFRPEKKMIEEISYWSRAFGERVRCVELDYCANINTMEDYLSLLDRKD